MIMLVFVRYSEDIFKGSSANGK